MKLPLFVLGFLTGILASYLILTHWWWPDIRLAAARPPVHVATAEVCPSPTPPSSQPSAFDPPPVLTPDPLAELNQAPPVQPTVEADLKARPPEVLPALPIVAPATSIELPLLQTDLDRLRMRSLLLPVQGITSKALRDTFADDRSGRRHQAIDIMAARGTPVIATDDGRVEKLFTSKPGGLTLYQFDAQGEYCYYYAHLDSYADGVAPGKVLRKGDVIGYVGSTGNASPTAPHLHFTIFRLGADKHWWEGTAINAYPLWGLSTGP